MLKIGLTGGIGSGKSTIAKIFQEKFNIPIIDADVISHQLVEPGQPALLKIQQTFGNHLADHQGQLDRALLRDMVFSDIQKKQQLEDILHPLIYQQMQIQFDTQTSPYTLFCIPLLIETNMTSFVDRILVIDCPVETQITRVQQRDHMPTEKILSILASQTTRDQRLSQANDVIDNSNSNTRLAEQVKKLHNQYLLLSNC